MFTMTTIDASTASNAVYLDFEGNTHKSPSLIGWLADGEVTHILLESALAPVIKPGSMQSAELEDALRQLRIVAGPRRIIGYSGHEVEIVQTYCTDQELRDWFLNTYVNAKLYIDKWVRKLVREGQIQKPQDRSLITAAKLVGITYPPAAGGNIVGKGLTRLRSQAANGRNYASLTAGAKRHLSRIIHHNTTDLKATRALLVAATAEVPLSLAPRKLSSAVRKFAMGVRVDARALEGIIGSDWEIESGWLLGTGMAIGPTLTQTTGSPRLQISVTAWGTHLKQPTMELTIGLAPSADSWVRPEASIEGGPRSLRLNIDDNWVTNLGAAVLDMWNFPISPSERLVDPLEIADYWHGCLARGERPSMHDFAKRSDVRLHHVRQACRSAWDAGLVNAPRPGLL